MSASGEDYTSKYYQDTFKTTNEVSGCYCQTRVSLALAKIEVHHFGELNLEAPRRSKVILDNTSQRNGLRPHASRTV
jgi:hypothetical protein